MTRLAAFVAAVLLATPACALDRTITVSGEATVAARPDQAMINLGVTTQAGNAREASDNNAKKMTSLLAAIKAAGVDDKDVQTRRLSLQPETNTSGGATKLTGFRATNQVAIRLRNVDQLSELLDRAVGAGANDISGIEFVVSDRDKLLDQARRDAIADAKRKAEIYAAAAGAAVGRPTAIEEGGVAPPRPLAEMRIRAATPVAVGEQTLHSTVTVSYELIQ